MLPSGAVIQNRYQVVRLLGQGGFGAVYQARDLRLGQIVALKENIGGDPRQFQQEALILANLRHPNLPRVSDHFVEPNGAQYLVMDFVEGEDLESVLQRQGALPETQVLAWFDQIIDAVAYLHNHNVIHRDIKPANIRITPAGQAVLVDFGIAKVYQPGQMTMSGARAVSPGYAAPEQYHGGTDHQSDVYSLGATLYALLTGGEPPDARALERGTATLTPPRVLNLALSVTAEQIILQAMAIQARQRFQSADAMRRAIKGMTVAPTLPTHQPSIPSSSTQPYVQPAKVNVIGLASIMAVVAVVCIGLAVGAYALLQGSLKIGQAPATATPTRDLVLPTVLPPPTLPPRPTDTPLPPPTPVVTITLPLPSTSTATRGAVVVRTPTYVPTKGPQPSPTVSASPGVYVLRLETDPAKIDVGDGSQKPQVGFKMTLLNSTGGMQTFSKWFVRVFLDPDQTTGDNAYKASFGESLKFNVNVGTGTVEVATQPHIVFAPGRCNYVAIPYYTTENNIAVPFQTVRGGPLYQPLKVCQ